MINFLTFFILGILIGLSIIYYLPNILKYLPEIDLDEDL